MAAKKPLTFSLHQPPPALAAAPELAARALPKATATGGRKQVGARIPEALYRQLKARAALSGEPVQALLETAVVEYLRQHGTGTE